MCSNEPHPFLTIAHRLDTGTRDMPVPTVEGSPSHRPAKKGRQRRGATSHVIDVNSQLVEAISQEKISVLKINGVTAIDCSYCIGLVCVANPILELYYKTVRKYCSEKARKKSH